jgi:hypothetical protein
MLTVPGTRIVEVRADEQSDWQDTGERFYDCFDAYVFGLRGPASKDIRVRMLE